MKRFFFLLIACLFTNFSLHAFFFEQDLSDHGPLKEQAEKMEKTLNNLIYFMNHYDGDYQKLDNFSLEVRQEYETLLALSVLPDPEGKIKKSEEAMSPDVEALCTGVEFGDFSQALNASNNLEKEVRQLMNLLS